jgi:hypothetical protein
MHKFCLLSLGTMLLSGCSSTTLNITRVKTPPPPDIGSAQALPGVPFYIKTAGCKHQTVWLQPVYTLTLSVKTTSEELVPTAQGSEPTKDQIASQPSATKSHSGNPSSPPSAANQSPKTKTNTSSCTFTKVISLGVSNSPNHTFQKLQSLLSEAGSASASDLQKIRDIFDAWDKITHGTYDPFSSSDEDIVTSNDVYLASNAITPELYVDYNTTYYFNSKKPLAGTSQATAKLADDGTLTEGTGQVESKTLETFLGLVPFSDVLKTIATGALPFATDQGALQCLSPAAQKATYEFELKVGTKALKRTHSAFVLTKDGSTLVNPPCELLNKPVTKPTYSAYNATVEEVSGAGDSKADGNTVKVNGTVTLPKAAGDKTSKNP